MIPSMKRWKELVSIAGRYDTVMVVSQWCCAEGATMPVKAVLKLFHKSKNLAFKGLLSLIILQSIWKTLVLSIQTFRLSICPLPAATQPGSQHTSLNRHHMHCTINGVLDVSEKEMFVSVSEGWKFYSIAGVVEVHSSQWQLGGAVNNF